MTTTGRKVQKFQTSFVGNFRVGGKVKGLVIWASLETHFRLHSPGTTGVQISSKDRKGSFIPRTRIQTERDKERERKT